MLIILDTVRADRLSTYGSTALTKHLEEFSRDSLIFENCISTSSHTQPVHATLFTGLFQNEHGCHGDLNAQAWNFGAPPPRPLSEKFTTLAEIFRNSGYNTGAVVANSTLSDNGWKQGFDTYDCCRSIGDVYRKYPFHPIVHLFSFVTNVYPKYMVAARRADDINQGALAFIDSVASSRFFLFLNYMEAHSPYCAPRPFAGYYLDTPFPQLYRLEQFLRYITRSQDKATFDAYQLSQYDRAIAYLDDQLGKLFARMKRLGIYDESIIIITSDHGELFGEHDLYFHSCPMYEGVMRVPLLIKFPNSERVGRVKNVIQPTDIFATILSVGGLSIPDGISGKAFGNTDEPAVGEFENYAIRQHRVLYDGPYKYMKYEKLNNPELYDLTLDPSEKDNLAEKLPAVVHAMEKKLQAWESQHPPRYPVAGEKKETITGETLEGLKALGYIH
jgi:arylsulfatase A-like enzyme